jgi:hypothetical protein
MRIKRWNGSAWVDDLPTVGVSNIETTGTPSSSTFLRGDGAWATPAGSSDADTVDSLHASSFIRSDANDDFSGTLNYTPDTGTILAVDGQAVIQRMTANGALTIGHDDAIILAGGDTSVTLNGNINNAVETVFVGAEGGFVAYAFPNNDTSWSNRKELNWNGTNLTLLGNTVATQSWVNSQGFLTTDTTLSTEQVQDIVGAMVSSNSESGISVTYQDGDGTLDFNVSDPTITLTGAVTGSGTMTNLGNVSIATTATADPTLTLAGDASGSATFTNLGNATLTVTVADDSHNHTIANVDGLSTSLANKVDTAGDTMTGDLTMEHDGESTANDSHGVVFTARFNSTDFERKLYMDDEANLLFGTDTIFHSGNDGSTSGLHADLLDGQQGSYYLDYNNFTNTPSDSDTVTQIRRDNTGTYRTGNINLMSGSGVTITEVASGSFSFAASGSGPTYSSETLYIKRIWSATVTSDEYTLRYNAGTGNGTAVSTSSTYTSISLGYTPASTDKFMIEFSNNTSNSVEKGICFVGHGTFSSTQGLSVLSYDGYHAVDSGQLKIAKYFCQWNISASSMRFRYGSKMVY